MERPILDIPGYYFDLEKKKYFKIQNTAPSTAAYSAADVKRRKTRDDRNEAKALHAWRQRGRIQLSKILAAPLAGGLLQRECGQSRFPLDGPAIFAAGLNPAGYFSAKIITTLFEDAWPSSDYLFAVNHRPDLGNSIIDVRLAKESSIATARLNSDRDGKIEEHDYTGFMERFGHSGQTTSLSIHDVERCAAMTWFSSSPNSGAAICPSLYDETYQLTAVHFGPGHSHGSEVDIFSSTAAPAASSIIFAFGTTQGLMLVDKRTFNPSWHTLGRGDRRNRPKDVFALEFLRDNTDIILSGSRGGNLHLTDLRVPLAESVPDTIQHASSITHIKQIDTHRILVAGLNSSLSQYDLRFRKDTAVVKPLQTGKNLARYNRVRTRTTLDYLDYHNNAAINIGFDVDLESNIIAAAQETDAGHAPVQLFSLHGGHTLASPGIRYPEFAPTGPALRCLKFARDRDGASKSLYVAFGAGEVQRYMWADKEQKYHHVLSDELTKFSG